MQVHPSQISPGEPFDVFYFLRNPTDSTTYYIRAVVYDVQTGEVLATENLTQTATNSRLFIKRIQAPPDPSGYGRNIVAIASVYTDSGYTTKSENYEEQEQYFLIKAVAPILGGGGVDYRVLRDIVQEEVSKGLKALPVPQELKIPDQPDMSFVEALFKKLSAIKSAVGNIPQTDLSAISEKLNALKTVLINLPAPQKLDLSGIATGLDSLSNELATLRTEMTQGTTNVVTTIDASLAKITDEIVPALTEAMDKTLKENELSVSMPASFTPRVSRPTRPEPQATDVGHLMAA